ncbi:hypothetical protein AURDEDRAFT_130394 [Auricularia subglabra TFB-10046 SS5]|nr:hypothetical protein AURDEDRAFT_130394 [Auricularia subglabra TFB-10046 SS5]
MRAGCADILPYGSKEQTCGWQGGLRNPTRANRPGPANPTHAGGSGSNRPKTGRSRGSGVTVGNTTQQTRQPPEHVSPAKDTTPSIFTDVDVAELRERAASNAPAPRMAFANLAFSLADLMEPVQGPMAEALVTTRSQTRASVRSNTTEAAGAKTTGNMAQAKPNTNEGRAEAKRARKAKPLERTLGMRYKEVLSYREHNPLPTLQLAMDPELRSWFVAGYKSDLAFQGKGADTIEHSWYAGNRSEERTDCCSSETQILCHACVFPSQSRPRSSGAHTSLLSNSPTRDQISRTCD